MPRPLAAFLLLFAATAGHAQTIEERIERLLDRMTIDQKVGQLHRDGNFNTLNDEVAGIPGFEMSDGPHGVGSANGFCTSFPVGVAMTATWDEDLVRRIGEALGQEFRGMGKNQALGPCIDLMRDPRAGRAPESAGEDPYLAAHLAAAYVAGMQSTTCIATVKHFDLNTKETGRQTNDYTVDDRTLIELYGAPFRAAVQEGGAWSVMNAYNKINGSRCAESRHLLAEVLRGLWGYPFYVVSDWGAVSDAARAIQAGTDVEMGSNHYGADLLDRVLSGAVPVAALDAAVGNQLRTKLVSGMIDGQPLNDRHDVDSQAHRQLALEAARECVVLLKNQDRILPLDPARLGSIALIGPSHDVARLDGRGSSGVLPVYSVSPLAGLTARLDPGVTITRAKGCDIQGGDTQGFAAAVAAAQGADVVVYVGGLDETMEGEELDRASGSIDLPGVQCDLIDALAAANPNLVVVLEGGGAIGVGKCIGSIKGLLYAFYPGQEGGNALAEAVLGQLNPGGKLPYTIPKDDAQLPPWGLDHSQDLVPGRGYRWFDRQGLTPEFPFGYGLSYTTFRYDNLTVTPESAAAGETVTVAVDVQNTGTIAGDEVVQLYLRAGPGGKPRPPQQLKGFLRVHLEPGERATVRFDLGSEELYCYDPATGSFVVEPGSYTVFAGGSSRDLPVSHGLTVTAAPPRPDLVVTQVRWVPPYPEPGQPVSFLATVKNQGTGPTPAATLHEVSFAVDGVEVATSAHRLQPIAPGQVATLLAQGPAGAVDWPAPAAGTYPVRAQVNPGGVIAETSTANNDTLATLVVRETNLALHRPVTVSSIERATLEGPHAVDGFTTTRWASAFADPQDITVDLGRRVDIRHVTLGWEFAFGRDYLIQVSDDGVAFTDAFHETAGDGGIDDVPVNASGRYLRMHGVQRGTGFGYSLWELQVFGTPGTIEPEEGRCADGIDNDQDGATDCADDDCKGGQECPGLAINRRIVLTPTGMTPRLSGQFQEYCRRGDWTLCPETTVAAGGSQLGLPGEAAPGAGRPGLWLYQHSGSVVIRLVRSGADVGFGW